MICVSIIEQDISECLKLIKKFDFVELRFDKIKPRFEYLPIFFGSKKKIIATCRNNSFFSEQKSAEILKKSVEYGAAYVDIEIEKSELIIEEIVAFAHKNNCKVIISYHNFEGTPGTDFLKKIIFKARAFGADIVKIATKANKTNDVSIVLSLYQAEKNILAFTMGKIGFASRIECLKLGAPFTYAAATNGKEAGDGQITENEMKKILDKSL